MLDISVIILTYNEELHIHRCIENVKCFTNEIFIVDSYSTDNTLNIAKKYGVKIYQNKWENNYAKQFNWGLANCSIKTKWILRLDADEYLTDELISELEEKLPFLESDVTGIVFKRRHIFLDRWMKRGTYPVELLRLFQNRKALCEQRFMDEHMQLLEGKSVKFCNDFVDHNLNNISWWTAKHNGYAIREAIDLLNMEYYLFDTNKDIVTIGNQAAKKRNKKHKYLEMPLFLRSFFYFAYRYIIKGGFLEGKEGFLWHFLQGWWYRTLVDAKIFEIKKVCGSDKEKIRSYILEKYNININ